MGWLDWFAPVVQPTFDFSDWGDPVPQRTLAELGIDARYALAPRLWPEYDAGNIRLSPASYPYMDAIAGDMYTVEQVFAATPAFHETFVSPAAMLFSLLHPPN